MPVLRPPALVQLLNHDFEHHDLVARGLIAARPESLRRRLCVGGQSAEPRDQFISDRAVNIMRKWFAVIVIGGIKICIRCIRYSFAPVKLTCGSSGGCRLAMAYWKRCSENAAEVEMATTVSDKFGQRLANGRGMFEAVPGTR